MPVPGAPRDTFVVSLFHAAAVSPALGKKSFFDEIGEVETFTEVLLRIDQHPLFFQRVVGSGRASTVLFSVESISP